MTHPDLVTAASLVLAAVNIAAQWLVAHHRPAGWVIVAAAQVPWCVYDVWTGQYGLLLITAVSLPVAYRGWRNFRAHHARHGRLLARLAAQPSDAPEPGRVAPSGP